VQLVGTSGPHIVSCRCSTCATSSSATWSSAKVWARSRWWAFAWTAASLPNTSRVQKLARAIAAVLKLSGDQTREVIEKEEARALHWQAIPLDGTVAF